MPITTTFEFEGATITVHRASVRDGVHAQVIYRTMGVHKDMADLEWEDIQFFAQFLTQATVSGAFPFTLPAPTADRATLLSAMDALYGLPRLFHTLWIVAVNGVQGEEKKISPPTTATP